MAARWRHPSGHQWNIAAGAHQATVVEVGGGIRDYTVDGEAILDGYPVEMMCPAAAGQVLAPWPDHLRDGHYDWNGESHQLPLDDATRHTAHHGLVRWEIWDRVDHTPDSVTAARAIQARPGYPYPVGMSTRWSVSPAGGLRADHTVTNFGRIPAPFGLGANVYLLVAGHEVGTAWLGVPSAHRLVVDDRMNPTGEAPVEGTAVDFRAARPIGDTVLDTVFRVTERGEDGVARTTLTGVDGRGVEVWQDDVFGWLRLHNGDGPSGSAGRALGVAPMTCPPDAFRSGTDVVTLEPGQRWRGSWGIRPIRPR